VISLWLPRFAIERRRPSPEAPFALFRREGGRELLVALDATAEAAGPAPGMALSEARALCPPLRAEPHAPAADAAGLARLADWAERFTPWVALDAAPAVSSAIGGGAGLWLDITGCAHLFGGEAGLLRALLAGCRRQGYTARAGLADTPGAAWALARYGAGGGPIRMAPPGGQRAALAPLPVAALRLPPEKVELLARFGLTRIGDLLALPPASLAARLGPEAGTRLRQALGEAGEALSPRRPQPSQQARLAFAEPIAAAEDLARAVERLIADLCEALQAAGQGVRRLRLVLFRADGGRQDLSLGTSRATREPAHLARLFAQRREELEPGFGVDLLLLAAEAVEPLSALQLALERAPGQEEGGGEGLAALVDRLALRLGPAAVGLQLPRQSHLPERAVSRRPALPLPPAASWPPTPPRPLRLLARPEPVEALALLPDHPPAHFRWRRRLHRVARAEGPERLSPEWWPAGAGAEVPPGAGAEAGEGERDYFRVEDEDGRRFWLYRRDGRWFLQGLFG